jgi:hypothetical protein
MLVILKRRFFDGTRIHEVEAGGTEIPEEFRKSLPRDAEILKTQKVREVVVEDDETDGDKKPAVKP